VALLEFFLATAGAGIVAADVFQRVARRFLMVVVAVWAMHVTMVVAMVVVVRMIVIAVGAVDVRFLLHGAYSGM
jgi:hypothetical protein